MTIGAAIFIAAVGAILRYAVTGSVSGIDIQMVGTILLIAGVIGLIVAIFLEFTTRNRVIHEVDDTRRDPRI